MKFLWVIFLWVNILLSENFWVKFFFLNFFLKKKFFLVTIFFFLQFEKKILEKVEIVFEKKFFFGYPWFDHLGGGRRPGGRTLSSYRYGYMRHGPHGIRPPGPLQLTWASVAHCAPSACPISLKVWTIMNFTHTSTASPRVTPLFVFNIFVYLHTIGAWVAVGCIYRVSR